jgi:peptidoglycan-N-acetylglucosamine deacetylase
MKSKSGIIALITVLINCGLLSCDGKNPLAKELPKAIASTPAPKIARFPKTDCSVSKCVALTFDDGPNQNAVKYLNMLQVPATFFVVGSRVQSNPRIVKQLSDAGHQVCNHSWNHANMAKLSPKAVDDQIAKTDAVIINTIGSKYKPCFRFPYASIPKVFFKSHPNLLHVGWSSDSLDWKTKDTNKQYQNVMKYVPENGIILFHDIHAGGLTTTPRIIADLQKKGFTFVTVDELNLPKGKVNMRG